MPLFYIRSVNMKVMVQVGPETDVEREVEEAKRTQHEAPDDYKEAWSEYMEEYN
jgi:prefoldin subunit 5